MTEADNARRFDNSDAFQAAMEAAQSLAPEFPLLSGADPASLGSSLGRAMLRSLRNPLGVGRAAARYASGSAAAAAATVARVLGAALDGPVAPERGDKRFADAAWQDNPAYYLVMQNYLLASRLLTEIVEAAGLEAEKDQKARFGAQMVIDALAPTNTLLGNPAALKKALDTGGLSVLRGIRNFTDDLIHNEGQPRQVDTTPFVLGENLAATPGKVVFRNHLMELIQYAPQTETVHRIPLLASPPWINKYYVMDLSPGRSFIEWAVQHGHTVFAISYRNPDASMADVQMEDYLIHGPLQALDVMADITGVDEANIVALCLGGTLAVSLLAYLAAEESDRVKSLTLLNTLADFSEPGVLGIFTDEPTVAGLEKEMDKTGYFDAGSMRRTFDVLRANDLIWNYVGSNWLMGEDPPAFDILAWNVDSTNMPAKMHSFYLRRCYLENQLALGQLELAGRRLDLSAITSDVLIVGAENDHIAPWTSSYKTVGLLSKAETQYVLSSAGHIAGIVNPPNPKARYWIGKELPPDPQLWRSRATEHVGSWWEAWAEWMPSRSGPKRKPPKLGSANYPPLEDAPGSYVRA